MVGRPPARYDVVMDRRRFGLTWWLWSLTGAALFAGLAGWTAGLPAACALTALQLVHQAARTRSLRSFPVQVRAAYLALLAAGCWPPLRAVHVLQLAGTVALIVFDYCPLVRTLSLLPWNRRAPLTRALLRATFFSPPVRNIADRAPRAA